LMAASATLALNPRRGSCTSASCPPAPSALSGHGSTLANCLIFGAKLDAIRPKAARFSNSDVRALQQSATRR
jgi:hypothetical protein